MASNMTAAEEQAWMEMATKQTLRKVLHFHVGGCDSADVWRCTCFARVLAAAAKKREVA